MMIGTGTDAGLHLLKKEWYVIFFLVMFFSVFYLIFCYFILQRSHKAPKQEEEYSSSRRHESSSRREESSSSRRHYEGESSVSFCLFNLCFFYLTCDVFIIYFSTSRSFLFHCFDFLINLFTVTLFQ